jgi:hypothetical protein
MSDKPLDVAEIQMRHKRNEGMCAECEQDWPCEAVRLCAEVERLRAALEARGPYCAQHGEHQPCSQHRWVGER